MSHIDTLKVYQEYKSTGMNDHQAMEFTNILENSFMTKVKELKADFASNTLQSILIGVFILVSSGCIGILWKLSIDMEMVKTGLQNQASQIERLSNYREN